MRSNGAVQSPRFISQTRIVTKLQANCKQIMLTALLKSLYDRLTSASIQEGIMSKVSTLNELYPTKCDFLLDIRHEYARYNYFLFRGYIAYQIRRPSFDFEHRLVADLAFGYIPKGYHVHHINEVTADNRASNLKILSPSEHMKLHWEKQAPINNQGELTQHGRRRTQTLTCPTCGASFKAKRSSAKYCSLRCVGVSRRTENMPSKEALEQQLLETPSFTAIGKLYGVSYNTISDWCELYQLPVRIADWKQASQLPAR
jgi:hypothetical protein